MASTAVALSVLAMTVAPATAFIAPSAFTTAGQGQVRYVIPASYSSTLRTSTSTIRMVAAPEKVTTGVRRNENFAKLKVWTALLSMNPRHSDEKFHRQLPRAFLDF